MSKTLRVLQVEDSATDAALIKRLLERAGYDVQVDRCETAAEMRQLLVGKPWDVVIADYRMPQFDAPGALKVLRETGLDIPFIVVSGTIGEDLAVDLMKAGAHDYVMKTSLARLVPAVEREMRDAVVRHERKKAEAAIQASEARFRSYIENAPLAVFVTDRDGRFVDFNRAATELLRGDIFTLFRMSIFDLHPSDDAATMGRDFVLLMDTGFIQGEYPVKTCDGQTIWVSLCATVIDNGQCLAYCQDITQRKQAERALHESEQRWQFALEGAGDGLWERNLQTDEAYFSPNWRAMLGYRENEIPNQPEEWDTRVHPDDYARVMAEVQKHLDGQTEVYVCEYRLQCKDGTYKWVLSRGRVISRAADGKPVRIIGTHTDITPRIQAQEEKEKLTNQLLQAQKMESVGRLAGGIAHDFNNLLTVINGYAGMAIEEAGGSQPLHSFVEEIRIAGERATSLVRQLLAFSRKQVLNPEVLDLNGIVTEMERMVLRLVGEDVEIVTKLKPSLPAVLVDRHQMEQVILNLVVNARDAMPQGGTLTIETGEGWQEGICTVCHTEIRPGNYVRVTVRDTGVGMDTEAQQHIFEPFYTTKPVGKGTGLGLATVQGIVVQSGGHVNFESTLELGTAFYVCLPAVEATPAAAEARPPAAAHGSETILLVEDQAEVRCFTARLLASFGYRVLEASGPEEALDLLAAHPVDLMLTDVVMPKMSGYDLALHARDVQPQLRVLFMSGYAEEQPAGLQDAAARVELIQKPFHADELAARIRAVLRPAPAARILVVDDEANIRRFLRTVLEKAGYEVEEAADGRQALKSIAKTGIDLMITDLVMPEQEGIETIHTIRRTHPAIKIIAISGAGGGLYLRMAKPLGADAALAKPLNADELLSEVKRVLGG